MIDFFGNFEKITKFPRDLASAVAPATNQAQKLCCIAPLPLHWELNRKDPWQWSACRSEGEQTDRQPDRQTDRQGPF